MTDADALEAAGLLDPVIAGAAMAFSRVSVVSNTLLLRGWRPRAARRGEYSMRRATPRLHADELEQKIREMQAMQRTLRNIAQRCHGDDRPDCPVLDDLAG